MQGTSPGRDEMTNGSWFFHNRVTTDQQGRDNRLSSQHLVSLVQNRDHYSKKKGRVNQAVEQKGTVIDGCG